MKQENKSAFECSGGEQCPYWTCEKKLFLSCEGAKITFPDKQSKIQYKQNFCSHIEGGYKGCTVYKMLTKYYEKMYEGGDSQ